jgi:tetratricopeptide (TPR) repeat protein
VPILRIPFLILAATLAACGHDEPPVPAVTTEFAPPAPPSEEAKQAFYRGKELYQSEQPIEALAEMRRAVELAPDWAEAELELGKLLLTLSFVRFGTATKEHALMDEGQAALERAVALRPDHVQSLYWAAHGHFVARRWEAAEPAFQRVLALDPVHKLATKELGIVLENLGDPARARAVFVRARELNRFDDEVRFHLGMVLLDLDDLAGAKEEFLACLAVNPAHPGPRTQLVTVCQRLGQPEESEHHAAELQRFKPLRQRLTAALERASARPRDPEALLDVAEVYLEIGMPVAALQWVERALALAPDNERAQGLKDALDAAGK